MQTAYYTIYMPIASGMVLAGMTEDSKLQVAQKICVKMGQYFQVRLGQQGRRSRGAARVRAAPMLGEGV